MKDEIKEFYNFTYLPFFNLVIRGETKESISYNRLQPVDPEAIYFTTENYGISSDGKGDVTDALQGAINKLKQEQNFGIIFIP